MSHCETLKPCGRSHQKHGCLSVPFSFLFHYRVASGAGLRRPSVRPSHILFTMWLPMALRTSVSSRGKSSRSSERTRDRWVPRFLWIPEHSMHMRAPRFRLAHVGSGEQHEGGLDFRKWILELLDWLYGSLRLQFITPAGDQFAKWKDQIMGVAIGKWRHKLCLFADDPMLYFKQHLFHV